MQKILKNLLIFKKKTAHTFSVLIFRCYHWLSALLEEQIHKGIKGEAPPLSTDKSSKLAYFWGWSDHIPGNCAPNSEKLFARQLLCTATACTKSTVGGDVKYIDHWSIIITFACVCLWYDPPSCHDTDEVGESAKNCKKIFKFPYTAAVWISSAFEAISAIFSLVWTPGQRNWRCLYKFWIWLSIQSDPRIWWKKVLTPCTI